MLVDTTRHLTAMRRSGGGPPAVVTQSGATMEGLLAFLRDADLGSMAHPAPGDLTVGGFLAIDGSTAIPDAVSAALPGETLGSLGTAKLGF
jgi:hypothetical protein